MDAASEKTKRDRECIRPFEEYRKGPYARYVAQLGQDMAFRPDSDFFAFADHVHSARRTLLGLDRLYVLFQSARNVARIPGAAVEVGTYRGGSAWFLASALKAFAGHEVPMHVFDTFAGHPADAISDVDVFQTAGEFTGSLGAVREFLASFGSVTIHPGDVRHTLSQLPSQAYRLVHLDTDLYQPILACLDYFGPRLSGGGIIVVDDYGSKKCPGVPKATAEYLRRADDFQVWDMRTEQLVLRR